MTNPSFRPSEPLMMLPSTNNQSMATPFFFGTPLTMTQPSAHSLPSYLPKPNALFSLNHQHHQGAPITQSHFLMATNHTHITENHNNDMVIDEPAPQSPSSSNSADNDDEETAAAILRALESGSLSPRIHNQHSLLRRQRKVSTASPTFNRRTKRVSSLVEINGISPPNGKDTIWDDYEMSSSPPHQVRTHAASWSGSNFDAIQQNNSNHANHYSFASTSSSPTHSSPMSTLPISIPKSRNTFGNGPNSALSSTAPSSSKKQRRAPRARLENHQCPNCHTSDSPLWRNCMIKGKILHLCNSCGLRYKKHKYCPHCYKVYYDAETNVHEWAQCVTCHNWTHRECLAQADIDSSNATPYRCLRCLGLLPDCE